MTCGSCVAKAKSAFLKLGDVLSADVQLAAPQATLSMQKHIGLNQLQAALSQAGNYTITEADGGMHHAGDADTEKPWYITYKPILLIGAYITGITFLLQSANGGMDWSAWMRHFMAAFFLVFSFFKMLDLPGFAQSYSSYDVVAQRWPAWGYIYPFVELLLGLAFLLNFNPVVTNAVTLVVMAVSIVGVLQTVLNKRKIQCACLGAVFDLPMSSITIIEDGIMIIMSAAMLFHLLG